jgi:hypothetical protein
LSATYLGRYPTLKKSFNALSISIAGEVCVRSKLARFHRYRIAGVCVLIAILAVGFAGCSGGNPQSAGVAPVSTTSPASAVVPVGTDVRFTATATGVPAPSVQWQVSSNGGVTFANLAGATSTILVVATTPALNGNQYKAVFTNAVGITETIAATLVVNSSPAITSNPTNLTQNAGIVATFTAAASGNPAPTVQWIMSSNGGATFSVVPGATSTTFSLTASAAQNGCEYEAVFTSVSGSATTTAAILTVLSAPDVTVNPTNLSVGTGGTATFVAAANGDPAPTVQWMVSADSGVTFSAVLGAISPTLSFATALAQNGNSYEAVFSNSVNYSTTTAATLTVTSGSSVSVSIIDPSNPSFTLGTDGIVNLAAAIANGATGVGVNWSANDVSGVRGRGTLTPSAGSIFGATMCVFYAIDSTGSGILISVDPILLDPQIVSIGN